MGTRRVLALAGLLVLSGVGGLLGGCGGSVPSRGHVDEPVPRLEPRSQYGNPSSYVVFGRRYYVRHSAYGYRERGIASWYGPKFHGKRTSSGEPYDMHAMTAAHKTLPLPSYVRVRNLENGRSVVVRVNDRGPFVKNRLIDLSYAAANALGIVATGTGLVEVEAIDPRAPTEVAVRSFPLPSGEQPPETAIYIQLGAFESEANARGLQERLLKAGEFDVHVEPAKVLDKSLYRVRMGPLASVAEADRAYLRLESLGFSGHRIVVD
jgi:rare lipoprotein A